MKQLKLLNGVMMPIYGLGTFKVEGGQSGVDVVKNALSVGYRHIDTAKVYENEFEVGKAIKESGLSRKEIFITTKQKENYEGDKNLIRQDIEDSFKQLQTDYIDLLLIHWPHHNPKINAITWSVLEEFYQAGRLKAIGVSNFQIHHLEELKKTAKVLPMVNQIELHPGLQQHRLTQYCQNEGIVVTSYGPFMKGLVYEGKYHDVLGGIAAKHQATIAQVIIAWGLQRDLVMIPKTVRKERLIENLAGVNLVLDKEDLQLIKCLNAGSRVYTDPDNHPFFPF